MDCPIRAESGKGRSAHIFNLNERAVCESTVIYVTYVSNVTYVPSSHHINHITHIHNIQGPVANLWVAGLL